MKSPVVVMITTMLFSAVNTASAAKPISVTFESEGTTPDKQAFANYTVKCSNGTEYSLTAWDKRKTWCLGNQSRKNCYKKQIKAAKKACRSKT